MPAFWAALLLCSLLAPPQGTMSLVAKVNVGDTTKSLAKLDLHKLTNGLLGGNLLSGLLDKDKPLGKVLRDGVLGGLLGRDGAVGSLLRGDGAVSHLLDEDGVLGGLLGINGAVGSLLGRDGAVGSLLGGDGAVGSLLGGDGADGSLLGGVGADGSLLGGVGADSSLLGGVGADGSLLGRVGAVGNLLGIDGAVGSLLGGDGAVGHLLDEDGALGELLGRVGADGSLLGGVGADGSLLGGVGAVGNLLGRDGAVGSLLGRDGAVGSLLGGVGADGSLLGRDGAVGSLLGRDGAVGSLLGGAGAVGNLLGRDGAVGSLLGGVGADGSLLGGVGAVGNLLGRDGAVGSLLGRDGAVGSLLGGAGAVGSLLGRDGAVGSLLGEDVGVNSINQDGLLGSLLGSLLGRGGVLDGLLGKNGLVDGVLDTLFGVLLGKHGLLGKDGLVGNILGGNVGDLTGLKIVNNTLPKISLHALPGFRYQVGFNTQLLVETTSAPGRALCLQVEADVVMLVQDKWAAHQNNKDCETSDISVRVRPKVPLLDQPLKRFLSDALSDVGCDIVGTGLSAVSTLLGSRTSPLPLRALRDLPPFSIVSDDAMQLDLNLLVGDAKGSVVASTQGPPLPATLLLAASRPPQLSLPQHALSTLLELAQEQGAFNLSITNSMVPDGISLSTAALLPLIPQLSRILPRSLPLELRVEVADEPVVAVRDGGATATLKASIGILSPSLQFSQAPLLSFDADIVLNVIPLVTSGKLQTSLALDSINLTRAPLRLNPVSASLLEGWVQQVLAGAYVPAINDAVSVSIPLPNVISSTVRNAKVDFTDADDSSDQTNLKRSCSRGPLALLSV